MFAISTSSKSGGRNRLGLVTTIVVCLSLLPLAACVGISSAERLQLGSVVTKTKVDFEELSPGYVIPVFKPLGATT